MKKPLLVSFALLAAAIISSAENVDRKEKYDSFSSIEIGDDFIVTLQTGPEYSVTFSADARLSDFCRVYRLGSLLKIDIDQSSFTKELKAQMKKKDNDIHTPNVTITIPSSSALESITLKEKVEFICMSELHFARKFHFIATDNTTVLDFKINAPEVVCELNKKAVGKFTISASNFEILTDNNSAANVTVKSTNSQIEMRGSSNLSVSATVTNMKVNMAGQSNLDLNGTITTMDVQTKGSSVIQARSAAVTNVITNLSNGEFSVNATGKLKLYLEKGAKLIYDGLPEITIDKISNSSIFKLSDIKEKK